MGTGRALPWRGGIAVSCAGVLLAMLGPYGSYLNGPLEQRLVFWLTTCWIGFVLYGTLTARLVTRWRGRLSDWAGLVIGALVVSIPEAWLARELALWIWPDLAPALPSLPQWFGQTALLGLPFTAIGVAWSLYGKHGRPLAKREEMPPGEDPFAPEIADVDGIIALQMEDHYVRIHRAEGSRLILMPLKRAIRAMGDVEGLQTHRSWWVARSVVTEVSGTPRSMHLRLTNGLQVPVARSAVVLLRQAGWLRSDPGTP